MKPEILAKKLQFCSLFKHLDTPALVKLLQQHYFPVSNYPKGKYLFFRGDRYEELAIVVFGTLRAEMSDPSGHVMTVELLPACQLVASAFLFSPENYLPVDLVAETDVKLIRINKRELFKLCQSDGHIFEALLVDIGTRTAFLSQRLYMTKFSNIENKLAIYLLEQSKNAGSLNFTISRSKQQLADLFGVARTSVSRVCGQFTEQGIISFQGRTFSIMDVEALKAMVVQ